MKIVADIFTITDENIISISVDRNIDELSLTFPIDEMHATVRMTDDKVSYFRYNTHIYVIDDEKIWSTTAFYTRETKKKGYNIYELYGVSSVGLLADRDFPGKMFARKDNFSRWTFEEAVEAILGGDFDYNFTDTCTDFEVEGWIGHCSQREAIRHLCFATGVVAFMGNSGVLSFRKAFEDATFADMSDMKSLQPYEVLDEYTLSEGVQYSSYSCDFYTFSESPTGGDEYVTDPSTGKNYYYYSNKQTETNTNYPTTQPTNELYIQDEMLLNARLGESIGIFNRLGKYYKGNLTLEFSVVTELEPNNYCVGFFDGEKMLCGYASKTSTQYGRNRFTEFKCDMAFIQPSKVVTMNYKNSAGDLLAARKIYKGNEEKLQVMNPIITLRLDNRHKIVYMSDELITEIDDTFGDTTSIDIPCTAALIQNGDVLEINAVDKAVQIGSSITIGGRQNE